MNTKIQFKMDVKFWALCFYIYIVLIFHSTSGQSEVSVKLLVKKYIERGSSVLLRCVHNIESNVLYKVAWMKNDKDEGKLFEYIADRTPPFRNYTIRGAEIDWQNTSKSQLSLKNLDFEATGFYYCKVTTSTPIYTKPSQDEQIIVILSQVSSPRISLNKRFFYVGQQLVANCTTSKARPLPHITWLINGEKINEKYVKQIYPHGSGSKTLLRAKEQNQVKPKNQDPIATTRIHNKNLKGLLLIQKDETPVKKYTFDKNFFGNSNVLHNTLSRSVSYTKKFQKIDSSMKYFNLKTYRNLISRKARRHINGTCLFGEILNICSTYVNANSNKYKKKKKRNSGSTPGLFGMGTRSHRGIISSSQLNLQISDHHIGKHNKLEITCISTIPSYVIAGEQFADYKTHSLTVDIIKTDLSSPMPSMSGMAALGNASQGNKKHNHVALKLYCVIFSLILRLQHN